MTRKKNVLALAAAASAEEVEGTVHAFLVACMQQFDDSSCRNLSLSNHVMSINMTR